MADTSPPAAKPKAITPSEIILYLEKDHRTSVRFYEERKAEFGPNLQHERELAIQKSVVNMFHYIYNDPEGFKDFAKRVKARFGEWPPRLPPQEPEGETVYVLEVVEGEA